MIVLVSRSHKDSFTNNYLYLGRLMFYRKLILQCNSVILTLFFIMHCKVHLKATLLQIFLFNLNKQTMDFIYLRNACKQPNCCTFLTMNYYAIILYINRLCACVHYILWAQKYYHLMLCIF